VSVVAGAKPIISLQGIGKRFGAVRALHEVDLSVGEGEVVALVGDNGAGKSTLVKIMSGVFAPDAGRILIRGEERAFATPADARASGIETIYQDLALAGNLSIGENIYLGREPMRRLFGFLPALDREKMHQAAQEVVKHLDIEIADPRRPLGNMSGGQRQAVAISRAIHWNASLLIMDEPTAALGVPEQRRVIALIKSLKARGVSVIIVSHNMNDVFEVADRIVVLLRGENAGNLVAAQTTHEEVVQRMVRGDV
jgi:simple sugar transport system ATP-binding protein